MRLLVYCCSAAGGGGNDTKFYTSHASWGPGVFYWYFFLLATSSCCCNTSDCTTYGACATHIVSPVTFCTKKACVFWPVVHASSVMEFGRLLGSLVPHRHGTRRAVNSGNASCLHGVHSNFGGHKSAHLWIIQQHW